MLILCLGSEYFHEAFHRMGHSVIIPPHEEGYPLDSLFNNLRDRPDLIVAVDHLGQHAWPEGLANIYGVPKLYYAVDTPINFWWQRHYAHLFDHVFADQKPFAEKLKEEGLSASWLPVGVDTRSYQERDPGPSEKLYDFGFVGSLDEGRRPKRARLMSLLSQRYTLKTAGARQDGWIGPEESGQIYRQSRLALNENLFPGVTTRMLEAMASGSALFTEKAGGDLGELFKAGEDFAWFEPQELLEAAELWLGDEKLRNKTARRAAEKVLSSHDVFNRAESLLQTAGLTRSGKALTDEESWDREGKALFLTALRWPRESGQKRIVRAEGLFQKALLKNRLSPEGLYMLGHVKRLQKREEEAKKHLTKAYEAGEPRGALSMGILSLVMKEPKEARIWLSRFTENEDFPALSMDSLSFEAVKLIAQKLLDLGEDISPGFSRLPHDPAVWTAFEYYQSGFQGLPEDAEMAGGLARILDSHGASAEALDVARKGL